MTSSRKPDSVSSVKDHAGTRQVGADHWHDSDRQRHFELRNIRASRGN